MLRAFLSRVTSGLVVAVFLSCSLVYAQPATVAPAAPVPSQIKTAHKVFISNTTADGWSIQYFQKIGGSNRPFDEFYGAMKRWGRYELVDSPAEADLVFEMRFGELVGILGAPCVVSILDAKTHFILWTLVEPMPGAIRKGTWEKNFLQSLSKLMDDLKKISGETSPAEKPAN